MRMSLGKLLGVFIGFALIPLAANAQNTVQGSMHDLSLSGRGSVKAASERQVCLFCHATHVLASPQPMWNQKLSTVSSYNAYTSSTYQQTNNPVSTRSKLCLSCHDGTVAVGQTYFNPSGQFAVQGTLPAAANLGTDLSRNHPFGFTMPAIDDGEIKLSLTASPPATSDSAVKLFGNKIECVTCHDPHTPNRDSATPFMVRSNADSALCTACHDTSRGALAGWPLSQHALAKNSVESAANLPYSTVAMNACMNCHAGHNNSGTGARLLRDGPENTCANCHGGNPNVSPAPRNVIAELRSTYAHPVGIPVSPPHDPTERLPVSSSRHSECADCHDAHAAQATTLSNPPSVQQSLAGVSGINAAGSIVNPANNEYEICFKCHADSTNKPQSAAYGLYGREPIRATPSTDPFNIRLDLNSSVTRHNVVQAARPGVSASLRANMLDLSGNPTGRSLIGSQYLYCGDCHNNDAARASGGAAPNGPHGSNWTHLLERQYQENALPALGPGTDFASIAFTPGINGPYALCDKCHDLANKLNLIGGGVDTVFGKHQTHVVKDGASCSVCHASHGVQGATVTNNRHLVNFDTQIVAPIGNNPQPYLDTSKRQCFLICHGVSHNGLSY
jgi:predicted CXXCH cytochrome family protein